MINLLVIENNSEQCKNIVNYISQFCFDIRIYSMAYTDKEAIEIIKTQIPEVILLDLDLPNLSAFNILNYIAQNKITKYSNSILAFSNKLLNPSQLENNKYLNCYFKKPVALKKIVLRLNEIASIKMASSSEAFIKNKITHELELLNYDFSFHGTKYLIDAIYELYKNQDSFHDNLSRDIYPILARKHHKKANTIKCDITHATKIMFCDCKEEILSCYFNLTEKPTVKNVMFTILNKL